MARAALIVSVATSMAMFGSNLQKFLNEDVKSLITHVVTGKDQQPEDQYRQEPGLDAGGAVEH
ncbi:hypothetical protein PGKDCPLP_01936 [Stenotrophomonas maltophilia]|nr:hypothetical protein PGKDCPLP_01936 [Stenotrophomonas maltophilia]